MMLIDVSPIEIRDYAISYGWSLVKEALKDALFVLNSPKNDFKQLIFPVDPSTSDYPEMAEFAIHKMAEYCQKPFFSVMEEIREVNDDVIALRYYSDNKIINSLSFQEALESIESTKQMILAAGCTVINPNLYHKRLARSEALEILKKTRFRHTAEGSFVLKISCPVQLDLSPTHVDCEYDTLQKPISRQAFEVINYSSLKVLKSIEEDSFASLLKEQEASEKPVISYNFCESLVNLFDDERELPFELNFFWSRAYLQKLPSTDMISSVNFPYSFKSKLEELKNYFRPEDQESEDVFFGTVESLNGNEGVDKRRAGEVILSLYRESEIVRARVNLNADNYDRAYKAHGKSGGLIKVKGRLLPGKRIRTVENVSLFEIIEN